MICHPLRERRNHGYEPSCITVIWGCCSTDNGGNYQFLASKGFTYIAAMVDESSKITTLCCIDDGVHINSK